MEENKKLRELIYTDEFDRYYNSLDERTKRKFNECFTILREIRVISTKFIKVLVNTDRDLYELRVSVGFNEHRSILFSVDHDNIIQATKIVFLNSFLKKSSKDYDKEIKKAINILKTIEL
ncbi:MAG: type II toxin-antitoxin system RelE/ParE family toxin [Tannerella sp.]|jgi:hypothetical protein|nr:type II toxin-antitoxin system RelE/ParE family toxin [Tannerella sp.]